MALKFENNAICGGNSGGVNKPFINLMDVITSTRSSGCTSSDTIGETEVWALLCQSVQALQDLFLSDHERVDVITPSNFLLTPKGQVIFRVLSSKEKWKEMMIYAAPEYRKRNYTQLDSNNCDLEKMLVYSLGECLKLLKSVWELSAELRSVFASMSKQLASERASLIHLLHVVSEHSNSRRHQPFSHTVMDLYRKTIIYTKCMELKTPSTSYYRSLEQLHQPQLPPDEPKTNTYNNITDRLRRNTADRIRARRRSRSCVVTRAASRLYNITPTANLRQKESVIGPEFVLRAVLPAKQVNIDGVANEMKISTSRTIYTVIMLNGTKLEVTCKPEQITAGQLFEYIIRTEGIEENYFLALSIPISGDFVFLPADMKLSKVLSDLTLFVRVRFFLPSLRNLRCEQSRHLLYLQLRRSILENQFACTLQQLYAFGALALQAEFGDYKEKHESNHYFLLEHYLPESFINSDPSMCDNHRSVLTQIHSEKSGLNATSAEYEFIQFAQTLPNYGVHSYSATLVLKHEERAVWLRMHGQGIDLYDRMTDQSVINRFRWQSIETLCYSKHYLCIIPHRKMQMHFIGRQQRKYKLRMEQKKSYYTFRLASLHHQFFSRLRTEGGALGTLPQQYGIALLKDMKNERNALLSQNDMCPIEVHQNKENECPPLARCCPDGNNKGRTGVKMGVRAFARSLEMIPTMVHAEKENRRRRYSQHSTGDSSSSGSHGNDGCYVINANTSMDDNYFAFDYQESLSQTLLEKLRNFSFADERLLKTVTIHRNANNNRLGIEVTEGTNGNIYIQTVEKNWCVNKELRVGDQIVAVNGLSLLAMQYENALKSLLEQCANNSNVVLIVARKETDMQIPSSSSTLPSPISNIALPRSLGLGRRWRGPVRYPVTPNKNNLEQNYSFFSDYDIDDGDGNDDVQKQEQIFI